MMGTCRHGYIHSDSAVMQEALAHDGNLQTWVLAQSQRSDARGMRTVEGPGGEEQQARHLDTQTLMQKVTKL